MFESTALNQVMPLAGRRGAMEHHTVEGLIVNLLKLFKHFVSQNTDGVEDTWRPWTVLYRTSGADGPHLSLNSQFLDDEHLAIVQ